MVSINSIAKYSSVLRSKIIINTNLHLHKPKALFGLYGEAPFKLWVYYFFEVYSEKSKYNIRCDTAWFVSLSGSAA